MSSTKHALSLTLELPLQWPSLEEAPDRMDTLLAISRHHDALWVGAQMEAIVQSWPEGVDQATFKQVWDKSEEEGVKVKIMCTMLHDPDRLLAGFGTWQHTDHIDDLHEWEGGIDVYTQASRSTMKLFNDVMGEDPLSKQEIESLREQLPAKVFGPQVFAQARADRLEEDLPATSATPKPRM